MVPRDRNCMDRRNNEKGRKYEVIIKDPGIDIPENAEYIASVKV